jgi:hypothetical protein
MPTSRWSGMGVKQYIAGNRPDPMGVFGRLVEIINHFIDFHYVRTDRASLILMNIERSAIKV